MKTIAGFFGHILLAMVKGFIFTGVVAAVLAFGALYVTSPTHALTPSTTNTALAGVIVLLAAILGAAVALIYHLSHLDTARHAMKRYSDYRDANRRGQLATVRLARRSQ